MYRYEYIHVYICTYYTCTNILVPVYIKLKARSYTYSVKIFKILIKFPISDYVL